MILPTSTVREFGTATLLAMLVTTMLFFALYVCGQWNIAKRPRRWSSFHSNDEIRAALALFTVCFGSALRGAAALVMLHEQNRGEAGASSWPMSIAYASGTFITVWGLICLMRALSRYTWPRSTWLWLAGTAVAFGVVCVVLP